MTRRRSPRQWNYQTVSHTTCVVIKPSLIQLVSGYFAFLETIGSNIPFLLDDVIDHIFVNISRSQFVLRFGKFVLQTRVPLLGPTWFYEQLRFFLSYVFWWQNCMPVQWNAWLKPQPPKRWSAWKTDNGDIWWGVFVSIVNSKHLIAKVGILGTAKLWLGFFPCKVMESELCAMTFRCTVFLCMVNQTITTRFPAKQSWKISYIAANSLGHVPSYA